MNYFPLFFDLRDRPLLICGGSAEVLKKVEKLRPFGPRITVIADHFDPSVRAHLRALAAPGDGSITLRERPFAPSDLDEPSPVCVIIAENEAATARIAEVCRARHIPVNAVDRTAFCDWIFPSTVATDHLCIGVSSGGMSPTAAVALRERIENMLPDRLDDILEWMVPARAEVRRTVPPDQRKAALRALFEQAAEQNRPLTGDETSALLSDFTAPGKADPS